MAHVQMALVIGGGVAGPAAALALRKAGIEARVYEAHPSAQHGLGGMLSIAPNGINALRLLGLDEEAQRIGQPIRSMVIANGRGKTLMRFDGLAGLPPSRVAARSDVYRVLNEASTSRGIVTEFGKKLTGVDMASDGITARFADGTTARGDILIGADGIHSTVRALIDPRAPGPRYDGLLGFGAAADIDAPGDPDAMHLVFGKRAFLGYWRQPAGGTAWFSNLPRTQPLSTSEARQLGAVEWLRQLRDIYSDDIPARDLVSHTRPEGLFILGALDMLPPPRRWWRDRMVLVGDSAHAPNHSSGQGVSLALESALELARCLRDIADIPSAFAAYEQLRRPRVTRIAAEAARNNERKAAGPIAGAFMSLLMPLLARTAAPPEKLFGWVHGYRIDWEAPATAPLPAGAP